MLTIKKMKKLILLFVLILGFPILQGCQNIRSVLNREPVQVITVTLPLAPSPTPSLTMIPTATFTPSPTPTLTPTPTTTLFVLDQTPLVSGFEAISTGNANRVSALAEWQVPDLIDLQWTPDGYNLAAATTDQIILFDVYTRNQVRTLYPQSKGLMRIGFSPDYFGTWLVAGSRWGSEKDGYQSAIELWRGPDWQPLGILSGSPRGLSDLAFSPDGKALATIYASPIEQENLIEFIDTSRWVISSTLSTGSVLKVNYSPDSVFLATSPNRYSVQIWQINQPRLASQFNTSFTGAINTMAYSPDGSLLATGAHDGVITLWDVTTGLKVLNMNSEAAIASLAFSPDGKMLASGSSFEDSLIRLWSVETGELLRELEGHVHGVDHVLFSPGGEWLVSGSYAGELRLWGVRP